MYLRAPPQIPIKISPVLRNLITVIFCYQISHKLLKTLRLWQVSFPLYIPLCYIVPPVFTDSGKGKARATKSYTTKWNWHGELIEMLIYFLIDFEGDTIWILFSQNTICTTIASISTHPPDICYGLTATKQKRLRTTPSSQCSLNALAIDEPLEYVKLYLDGAMQMWVDAEVSTDISLRPKMILLGFRYFSRK